MSYILTLLREKSPTTDSGVRGGVLLSLVVFFLFVDAQYEDKEIRPMLVFGPNLTFSNRQFPTLFAGKH